jgi:hypothetical protein
VAKRDGLFLTGVSRIVTAGAKSARKITTLPATLQIQSQRDQTRFKNRPCSTESFLSVSTITTVGHKLALWLFIPIVLMKIGISLSSIFDYLAERELEVIAREKLSPNGSNGSEPRYCSCAELIVNGRRIPSPPGHSCEYVAERSKLVAEADKRTRAVVDSRVRNRDNWTRRFCSEIEKLSAPLLKRSSPSTRPSSLALKMEGRRFGRWTIIQYVGRQEGMQGLLATAKCDCGKIAVVDIHKLAAGESKSCGACRLI